MTDQILKIIEGVFEKLETEEVGIDELQFGFIPRCGTTYFETFTEKILGKKRRICILYL